MPRPAPWPAPWSVGLGAVSVLKHFGTASDVADVVAFPASPDSRRITGRVGIPTRRGLPAAPALNDPRPVDPCGAGATPARLVYTTWECLTPQAPVESS